MNKLEQINATFSTLALTDTDNEIKKYDSKTNTCYIYNTKTKKKSNITTATTEAIETTTTNTTNTTNTTLSGTYVRVNTRCVIHTATETRKHLIKLDEAEKKRIEK